MRPRTILFCKKFTRRGFDHAVITRRPDSTSWIVYVCICNRVSHRISPAPPVISIFRYYGAHNDEIS